MEKTFEYKVHKFSLCCSLHGIGKMQSKGHQDGETYHVTQDDM